MRIMLKDKLCLVKLKNVPLLYIFTVRALHFLNILVYLKIAGNPGKVSIWITASTLSD